MLESIIIKNFRSCVDVSLRLGEPLIALVGKNGAGKTNILHAIQLAAELCVGDAEPIYSLRPHIPDKPTEFSIGFDCDNSKYTYRVSRYAGNGSESPRYREELKNGPVTLFERDGELVSASGTNLPAPMRIGTGTATLPALMQLLPQDAPLIRELALVANFLRAVRHYPLLRPFREHQIKAEAPIIIHESYTRWKNLLAQGKGRDSVQMRLLDLYLEDNDRFEEIRNLIGDNGLGIISEIRVHKFRPSEEFSDKNSDAKMAYVLYFAPGRSLAGSAGWFFYDGLSAGTWRVLELITSLIYDRSSCMLVEQPEDSIHPGLLEKVIDILGTYSHRTQLICATHSPNVVNYVGRNGIRLVKAENGVTTVEELSEPAKAEADKYIRDEGTLSEFLGTL